jgi:hypothetical protein
MTACPGTSRAATHRVDGLSVDHRTADQELTASVCPPRSRGGGFSGRKQALQAEVDRRARGRDTIGTCQLVSSPIEDIAQPSPTDAGRCQVHACPVCWWPRWCSCWLRRRARERCRGRPRSTLRGPTPALAIWGLCRAGRGVVRGGGWIRLGGSRCLDGPACWRRDLECGDAAGGERDLEHRVSGCRPVRRR